jgi:hypothetical protein
MKRKLRAEVARAMGLKWEWDYKARRWKCNSTVGVWELWYQDTHWVLVSPGGAIYTLEKQHRYDAMVQAGRKIAEVERYLAGR